MGTLWLVIIIIGVSALRGRRRDKRQANWQGDDGWDSEINKQVKKSKKGRKSKSSDDLAYAEIHTMDLSMPSPKSLDVSDLDLAPSDPTPASAPSGALKPLGDIGYDVTEEKVDEDEFTIGDLIDGLL
jgi:hypothetical protein